MNSFRKSYYAQQRRQSSGPRNLPCPDCQEPNRMTQGEINAGHHCAACTRAIEGYQEPSYNEDAGCMEY